MRIVYQIHLDTERDWTFANGLDDISYYVESPLKWSFGNQNPLDNIAAPASMQMKLHNNGDLDYEDPEALYYDKIREGNLVRVQAWDGSSFVTMAVMAITNIQPAIEGLDKKLYLECGDILKEFLNAEFVPPLQTNVRVDEVLSRLHEGNKAIYPYESYYAFVGHSSIGDGSGAFYGPPFTDFEEALKTLAFIGDNLGRDNKTRVSNYIKDAVEAEINGLYWFDVRSEKFRFLNRHHASDTAPVWMLIDGAIHEYIPPNKYMVNQYTVNYYPRKVGTANSTLYDSDSVPFGIAAQETRKMTLRYRDPDFPSAAVGALEVLNPIMGVDIIGNRNEDGSGEDWTRFLIVSLEKGAASTELTIFCRKVGDPVYVTKIQLKGRPVTIYNKESVSEINDDSIYRHKRKFGYKDLFGVGEQDYAQAFARFMVDSYGEPTVMLERITVTATPDNLSQIVNRTIGDVITVVDNQKGHEGDYMIVGEKHTADPDTGKHEVSYLLRSAGRGAIFTLGTSTYDEGDLVGI